MEVQELLKEIEALKVRLARYEKPAKVPRVPCGHVTAKGTVCKKYCLEGMKTCKVHGRPVKEKPVKVPKPPKVSCTGMNMRGNPCKNKCVPGETYCERHDPSAPPRVKELKKVKKSHEPPRHTHGVGEVSVVPCGLCETHGDIFSEEPEVDWDVEGDRLVNDPEVKKFMEELEVDLSGGDEEEK